jgi:hypothetical protein
MLHLIQDANLHNKPLQLISFDIEKAFDKISHTVITQSLEEFGFPREYVEAVKNYTLPGEAYVEVNGKKSQQIEIKMGAGHTGHYAEIGGLGGRPKTAENAICYYLFIFICTAIEDQE